MLWMMFFALPFALFVATVIVFYKQKSKLSFWRNAAFIFGLAANGLSAAVLLAFMIHAYIAAHGTAPVDLDRLYPIIPMFALTFLAAVCAWTGKGMARVMLAADGLLTVASWYFAALASSP